MESTFKLTFISRHGLQLRIEKNIFHLEVPHLSPMTTNYSENMLFVCFFISVCVSSI